MITLFKRQKVDEQKVARITKEYLFEEKNKYLPESSYRRLAQRLNILEDIGEEDDYYKTMNLFIESEKNRNEMLKNLITLGITTGATIKLAHDNRALLQKIFDSSMTLEVDGTHTTLEGRGVVSGALSKLVNQVFTK